MEKSNQQTQLENLEEKIRNEMLFMNKQIKTAPIKGYDFNKGVNYDEIFKSYATTGFQASNLAHGIDIVNQMISWRLSDEPLNTNDDE